MEVATRRWIERRGDFPLQRGKTLLSHIDAWHLVKERTRIGMGGCFKQGVCISRLDDAAEIHDCYPIRDVTDHT